MHNVNICFIYELIFQGTMHPKMQAISSTDGFTTLTSHMLYVDKHIRKGGKHIEGGGSIQMSAMADTVLLPYIQNAAL